MTQGLAVALQVVKAAGNKSPRQLKFIADFVAFPSHLPPPSFPTPIGNPGPSVRLCCRRWNIRPWGIRLCRKSAKIRAYEGPIVTWAYCPNPTPPPYNGLCPPSSHSLYPPPKGTAENFLSYQSNRHGFLIVSIKSPIYDKQPLPFIERLHPLV